MQFSNQFAGGGIFLEGKSKKNNKNEKIMALTVFLGSILCVYVLFGDFLSVSLIDKQTCTIDQNICNSNETCKFLWVPCVGQTQPYKYDPITTILFGEKTCDAPNLFRSVCVYEYENNYSTSTP
ncbi:hypothetical protein GQ473_07060 [archaeon]|nr:hypothetical protein [archaeon]